MIQRRGNIAGKELKLIKREKKNKAKAGRRHKNYVYAGFDRAEELPRVETKCKFAEGIGLTATLLAEIVRQGTEGIGKENRETVKKAVLQTVVKELGKV